jgi:hypothetical protein
VAVTKKGEVVSVVYRKDLHKTETMARNYDLFIYNPLALFTVITNVDQLRSLSSLLLT